MWHDSFLLGFLWLAFLRGLLLRTLVSCSSAGSRGRPTRCLVPIVVGETENRQPLDSLYQLLRNCRIRSCRNCRQVAHSSWYRELCPVHRGAIAMSGSSGKVPPELRAHYAIMKARSGSKKPRPFTSLPSVASSSFREHTVDPLCEFLCLCLFGRASNEMKSVSSNCERLAVHRLSEI